MNIEDLRSRKQDTIAMVIRHGGKIPVRVFGSVARGDARPDSDIDLLIELGPDKSGFDRAVLQIDLEELLGVKVDAISPRGVFPPIRDSILADAVAL